MFLSWCFNFIKYIFEMGDSSSNPDNNNNILPKPEILELEFQSHVMDSRRFGKNVASSSGSNVRSFFAEMGFVPSLVDKVIKENGEDNVDLLLEILMECSGTQNSTSSSLDSLHNLLEGKNESNCPECYTFVQPKEEPDVFGIDSDKRARVLRMNFSVKEVDFAMEKLGIDASIDEIVDFIIAAQIAANIDEETDDKLEGDADKSKDGSNEILFGTMEKTLRLLEMGFSENEISLAIERFGAEVPVLELANSICAEQVGEKYIVKHKYYPRQSGMYRLNTARDCESSSVKMEDDQRLHSYSIKIKSEDFAEFAASRTSSLNLEELGRGKRPKQEYFEDYPDTQLGHIGIEENIKGKRLKPEYIDDLSLYYPPTCEEQKVDAGNTGFRIHGVSKPSSCKSVDRMVAKPPYFLYGNVVNVSFATWMKISQFLYAIEPEFVNTQLFSALSRREGYVHNLPTGNRFRILPKPPMSIEDAMPHVKKWWPSWDTRKQISCTNFETSSVSLLCDRLGRIITDSGGLLSSEQKRNILRHCQKLNLIWVGSNKVGPIEPEFLELILGYPLNHTQSAETGLMERLHSLSYCFQVDTLGYHISVLKFMFPEGITMLSLVSGIGGAEVALHRLGIHMKAVVSVETCETKRRILRRWWHSSGQTGELEQIEDIQKLTSKKIEGLIEKFGGFDFIVCQSPGTRTWKCPKMGDERSSFDFTLFYECVRVLQRVRDVMERKR